MQQMMYKAVVFVLLILIQHCLGAPYQSGTNRNAIETQKKSFSNRESKKDIFISRGWGAGGMPFSVLYMNPSFSSSKAPLTVETNVRSKNHQKSLPQVRTSMRQKSLGRPPHSRIPQLFVSYGWGPLGK